MKIRLATPADAETIGEIRVSAWKSAYINILPADFLAQMNPQANITSLREKLTTPSDKFMAIIAERDLKNTGFAILGMPRYETFSNTIELWALNVFPSYWRQGYAAALLQHALAQAQTLDKKTIELWCIKENNPARKLYEKSGFIFSGQERITSALTGYPIQEICYRRSIGESFRHENEISKVKV